MNENEKTRKLMLAIWKLLRADYWGDIEPDWFDPDSEEEQAAHLRVLMQRAVLKTEKK